MNNEPSPLPPEIFPDLATVSDLTWHPVSEDVPESGQAAAYFVYLPEGHAVVISWWNRGKKAWNTMDGVVIPEKYASHWMRMPWPKAPSPKG